MMMRCPNCDAHIDYVSYREDLIGTGTAEIGANDFRNFESGDTEGNGGLEYMCPECNETIDSYEDLLPIDESEEDEDTDEVNGNRPTSDTNIRVQ